MGGYRLPSRGGRKLDQESTSGDFCLSPDFLVLLTRVSTEYVVIITTSPKFVKLVNQFFWPEKTG